MLVAGVIGVEALADDVTAADGFIPGSCVERLRLINVDFINVDMIYYPVMTSAHLSAADAAARLGVKRETLYAYVSRGVLHRTLSLDGRTSLFDPREIDRLRSSRRRSADGEITTVISSGITRLDAAGHSYRDVPVSALLDHRFEAVADLLWDRTGPWESPAELLDRVRRAQAVLPPDAPLLDRMRLAVIFASSVDPLRSDPSVDAMCQAGRTMLSVMVDGLPVLDGLPLTERLSLTEPLTLTERLWCRLTPMQGTVAQKDCLNTAFVLLADHGLAASTFAVRVAASVRADPYSMALAGLGTVGGTLHGAASVAVHRLLERAEETSAADALGELLANHQRVPGVGHRVYRTIDPREVALMARVEQAWAADPRLATIEEMQRLLAERVPQPLNIDFALGAFTWLADMGAAGGTSIFIARTAGWIAHGIEEFGEKPVRFRPVARYIGPPPVGVPEIDHRP